MVLESNCVIWRLKSDEDDTHSTVDEGDGEGLSNSLPAIKIKDDTEVVPQACPNIPSEVQFPIEARRRQRLLDYSHKLGEADS